MADDNEGPSRIVGLDGRVPKSKRNRQAQEEKSPSTAQVREWIVAGVATGAKNIYDQLSEESAKNFQKLEDVVVARVLEQIERRSIRGRIRMRWVRVKDWARGYGMELGLVDPQSKPGHVKLEES